MKNVMYELQKLYFMLIRISLAKYRTMDISVKIYPDSSWLLHEIFTLLLSRQYAVSVWIIRVNSFFRLRMNSLCRTGNVENSSSIHTVVPTWTFSLQRQQQGSYQLKIITY